MGGSAARFNLSWGIVRASFSGAITLRGGSIARSPPWARWWGENQPLFPAGWLSYLTTSPANGPAPAEISGSQPSLEARANQSPAVRPSLVNRLPYPAAVGLLTVLYYGAARVGLVAAVAHGVVSSAWPPAGLALAALLLCGLRYWPGVTLGAFVINASSGVSALAAAAIAVGNTSEALVGALLLQRVARFRPSLERLRDVFDLVLLAAVFSTAISATVGVTSLWLSGAIARSSLGSLWLVWWSGDAMGVLGVAPVILSWMAGPRVRASGARVVEVLTFLLVLVLLTDRLFTTPFSYVYTIFPVVGWAALRFGPRGASTASLIVSALAVWYTLHGRGPFAASTPTHNLALLQIFIGLLSATALVLAALMAERRSAEQALSTSEAQYRILFNGNPTPLWVFDRETLAFLAVNEAAMRQYGYSGEEFLRMTIKDLRPAEDVARLHAKLATLEGGLAVAGEWRHRKKDGTIIHAEVTWHPVTFLGRPAGLTMAHDITRRKSLESQLLQAQKMEAIGRLAGGVAHDFNNLLTIILSSSDLLLQDANLDETSRAEVQEISRAARRAADLTRQLLAFSRRQVLEPQVLDLNALVINLEGMLRRLIGEDIELRTVITRETCTVQADPGQLEQVIMNLAVNARDAMPQGGKLTIETGLGGLDELYAQAHTPVEPRAYTMLAVSDTGIGMDAETKNHLFEPFFTTKERGKGTGLGLATVYGIVKQSGGYIWVYSEPGLGATFKIYLPCVDGVPEPLASKSVAPLSLQGSETVLVVEDEEGVRRLTRKALESRGYLVIAAGDGGEALRLAAAHQGPIHLLVTDVVMPDMSGRELAERLASVRPETKVLYLSGYTDDAIVIHGVLEPGIAFLQKPFTTLTLARKLREVLDAG